MNARRERARREAMAMITAGDDDRLARVMWESITVSEWEIARELAGAAAGALLVVSELQGVTEAEVLAQVAARWPPG